MAKHPKKQAIQFKQTTRTGWVLTLTVDELTNLLPPREPEQIPLITETNRAIAPRHADDIQDFLNETPTWALPAVTLAAVPEAITLNRSQIDLDPTNIRILDGQHRLQAIANLKHHWQIRASQPNADDDGTQNEKLEAFLNEEIPVTIFEVKDHGEQRQLFAWFAKNRQIEAPTRDYFDDSNPFNKIAKELMYDSTLLQGNVTWRTKNVPPKDTSLMTLAQVKDVVTTIHLGIERSPKPADNAAITPFPQQHDLKKKTLRFFDDFLPACTPSYNILDDLDNLTSKILTSRSSSFALDPKIIRLSANAWARWIEDQSHPTEDMLADVIGNLNLNRASPENDVEYTLQLTNDRKKLQPPRNPCWQRATITLLNKARV